MLIFNTGHINIGHTTIRFGIRSFKYASTMIKEVIASGYRHIGGPNLVCTHCKKSSARKFIKDNKVIYTCHKCYACWGDV